MSTNRNIVQVINKIKPLMESKGENTFMLKDISESAFYTAPEEMNTRWKQLAMYINSHVPMPPNDEIDLKVISIFMDISIDEARKKFGGYF